MHEKKKKRLHINKKKSIHVDCCEKTIQDKSSNIYFPICIVQWNKSSENRNSPLCQISQTPSDQNNLKSYKMLQLSTGLLLSFIIPRIILFLFCIIKKGIPLLWTASTKLRRSQSLFVNTYKMHIYKYVLFSAKSKDLSLWMTMWKLKNVRIRTWSSPLSVNLCKSM